MAAKSKPTVDDKKLKKLNEALRAIDGDFGVTYEEEKDCTVTVIEPLFQADPNPDNHGTIFKKNEKGDKEKEKKKRSESRKKKTVSKKPDADPKVAEKHLVLDKAARAPVINAPTVKKTVEKKKEQPTMVIFSIGQKKGHPFEGEIEGTTAIVAGGKPGQTLNLKWNKPYMFNFIGKEGSGYDLILTDSPSGGKNAKILNGTEPIPCGKANGVIVKNSPSIVYYQDRTRKFLGGMIHFTAK